MRESYERVLEKREKKFQGRGDLREEEVWKMRRFEGRGDLREHEEINKPTSNVFTVSDRWRRESKGCDKAIEIVSPLIRQIPAHSVIRLLHFTEINFNES